MAFKIDLTDPFQAELDSVSGGFKNTAPFKRKRRPRKPKKRSLFDLLNMGITIGFNNGGLVSKNQKKKCKYF